VGSKENKYSMALNRRLYTTDDDVMSTGSRATLAKLYDRASAVTPSIGGGNVALRRDHVDPRVPRSHADGPSRAPLVFERPHSVDTLRVDREVSLLTEPMVSRPVPTRIREGDGAFRTASHDSRVSQGSRVSRVSHLSEQIGAIGSVVTAVVHDLLAAQREDSDRQMQVQERQAQMHREENERQMQLMMAQREDSERRQDVQMRMMLAHRQETKLRVQEARQSAEREMELMREMHEMAGRHAQQTAQWREMEVEKTVRQAMEERQVKLVSGDTERARRQRLVQRELERKRSTRVSFPLGTGGESPLSSRASTPTTPKAFGYHSERENDANVYLAKAGVNQLENCDTNLVQSGENLTSVPPGYVLVPIAPSSTLGYAHSTPVGVGVASTIVPDVGPVRPSLVNTVGLEWGADAS